MPDRTRGRPTNRGPVRLRASRAAARSRAPVRARRHRRQRLTAHHRPEFAAHDRPELAADRRSRLAAHHRPRLQPTGDHGSRWGTDPGSRPVGGEHHVGPVHVLVGGAVGQPPSASAASASSASSASTTVPATGATPGETTSTSGVTTTTSPSYTRPTSGTTRGANWQRDQSGARHTATGRPTPTTTQASSPTTTTAVASSPTIASTTTTPATDGGYRPGADGAPSQQYGRGQQTDSSSSQPSRGFALGRALGAAERSAALEHDGQALPHADADRGEAVAATAVVQLVRHAPQDPRA